MQWVFRAAGNEVDEMNENSEVVRCKTKTMSERI